MDDTISRQAAIDALLEMHCKYDEDGYVWIIRCDACLRIDALPSAQPEIVRCKDCAHYGNDCVLLFPADGYCYDGERRGEEDE